MLDEVIVELVDNQPSQSDLRNSTNDLDSLRVLNCTKKRIMTYS